MIIAKKKITADEEIMDEPVQTEGAAPDEPAGDVEILDDEATELLFETTDVAQLIAEATGEPVEVETDEETEDVIFRVGDTELVASPEGDEEILEARRIPAKKPIKSSRGAQPAGRTKMTRKAPAKK